MHSISFHISTHFLIAGVHIIISTSVLLSEIVINSHIVAKPRKQSLKKITGWYMAQQIIKE